MGRYGFLHQGGNSGYQAINLAYLWGAKAIVLLGFDCSQPAGKEAHWFGQHEEGLINLQPFALWQSRFPALAEDLAHDGVQVINSSRETLLTCFDRAPIEVAAARLSQRPRAKPTLLVSGMQGLGDNLHQRSVVRQLMANFEVWLKTPWPSIYHDLASQGLRLLPSETNLRTQRKNSKREFSQYSPSRPQSFSREIRIWYSQDQVRKRGSFLGAMCAEAGLPETEFSLTIKFEWLEEAARLIAGWRTTKPILIYRPLVERVEWAGCAARNPDPEAYSKLLRSVRKDFFVVSIADLEPRVEWVVSEAIEADVEYHAGELGVEIIAALMRMSRAVFCSAGFALILAQAVGARVVAVFGGHESARFYSRGAKTDFFIEPNNPCECFSKVHSCNKTINIEAYVPRLRSFINGTD